MAEIDEDDQAGWEEACRREAAIRDLLKRYPQRLKTGAMDAVGREVEISRETLYRLIAGYRRTRTVCDHPQPIPSATDTSVPPRRAEDSSGDRWDHLQGFPCAERPGD